MEIQLAKKVEKLLYEIKNVERRLEELSKFRKKMLVSSTLLLRTFDNADNLLMIEADFCEGFLDNHAHQLEIFLKAKREELAEL